jgi:hypothetical protein
VSAPGRAREAFFDIHPLMSLASKCSMLTARWKTSGARRGLVLVPAAAGVRTYGAGDRAVPNGLRGVSERSIATRFEARSA